MVKIYQDRFANSYDLTITDDFLTLSFSREDSDPVDIAICSKEDIIKRISVLKNEEIKPLDFSFRQSDFKIYSFMNAEQDTLDVTLAYGKEKDILIIVSPELALTECAVHMNDYVNGVFGVRVVPRSKK